MAKKQRKKRPKELSGLALYTYLLREANNRNKKLPDSEKLSYKELRKAVSKDVLPAYKASKAKSDIALSRIILKTIRNYSLECDPRYIPASFLAPIEFFSLDAAINTIPACIYVKVNAEQFGETDIFLRAEYDYIGTGVRDIIEEIRANIGNDSSLAEFFGLVKIKPDRADDNKPDSYYIEYFVSIEGDTPWQEDDLKSNMPKRRPKKNVTELEKKWKKALLEGKKQKIQRNKEKFKKKKKTKQYQNAKLIKGYQTALKTFEILYNRGEISGRTFKKEKAELERKIKALS